MADVFISYARQDRPFVDALADVLRAAGLTVWFDRNLTVGEEFSKEIEAETRSAGCCVVVWSRASVDRPWVRAEAQLARGLGKLVPVMIEPCNIPLPFNGLHTHSMPRDAELSATAPAVLAIREQVRRVLDTVRRKRRDPAIGAERLQQLLVERANRDPDSPGDFIESHRLEVGGLRYYPLVVGKVSWRGQVAASIGYDREEEYVEEVKKPDPSGKGGPITEQVRKKRTVTTWTPHASPASGSLDVALPAVEATGDIARALETFSHKAALLADELPEAAEVVKPLADVFALPKSRALITGEIVRQATDKLPGDKKRDVKVTETIDTTDARLVYLPLWSATVHYGEAQSPLTASGLAADDVLFDMPKDRQLLADREKRDNASLLALLAGVAAAAIGGGDAFLRAMPKPALAASAAAALLLAGWLLRWPFVDRRLAATIEAREAANAERRRKAAAAAGLETKAAAVPATAAEGGGVWHVVGWIAAAASAGVGAHLLLRVLTTG